MQYVLGSPLERGNSDVITNLEDTAGTIKPGRVVSLKADGTAKAYASGDGNIFGVSGYREANNRLAVVRCGLNVPVAVDASADAAVGKKVYLTAAGLATDAAKTGEADNVPTGAIFKSGKVTGVDAVTRETVDAALIDFPGGL